MELLKEGMIGSFEEDYNSNGVANHEKYMIFWRIRVDVNDDGTRINETSGTHTYKR